MNDEMLVNETTSEETFEIAVNDPANNTQQEPVNNQAAEALQEEMKKVIIDTKKNGIVLNAKQSIMLLENEYDKKYKYRDDIRRKVSGLIESADANLIKKTTIAAMGEESLINNPDYWLSPAFLALCAWYTNDRETATNAINIALSRDAEMTSLLLCFVHLRANRINTATKWLIKYLDMQTPDKIDDKITLIIDSITTGLFPSSMQEICLNKINEWLNTINVDNIKDNEINRWSELLQELSNKGEKAEYPYINKYVKEHQELLNYTSFLNNKNNIDEYFNNIMNQTEETKESYIHKIDQMIHILIFNHDDSEKNILNEIYKNKCIVTCGGDIEESSKMLVKNSYILNSYNNLYTHLTNICLIPNDEISDNTKKFAISITKELIIESYQRHMDKYKYSYESPLTITIEDLILNTNNGSNERELVDQIKEQNEKKYHSYIYEQSIIGIYNILTIIGAILVLIFLNKYLLVVAISLGASIIYNFATINKRVKERKEKINTVDKIKKENIILLLNILCEIVENYFNSQEKLETYNKFINHLHELNYKNYFTKTIDNNKRNIISGGNYE